MSSALYRVPFAGAVNIQNWWANNLWAVWAPHRLSLPQGSAGGILPGASQHRQEHTNCYAFLRLCTWEQDNLGKLQLLRQRKFVTWDAFLYTVVHPYSGSFTHFQSKRKESLNSRQQLPWEFSFNVFCLKVSCGGKTALPWHTRSNKLALPPSFHRKSCQDHWLFTTYFLLHSLKQHELQSQTLVWGKEMQLYVVIRKAVQWYLP